MTPEEQCEELLDTLLPFAEKQNEKAPRILSVCGSCSDG